MLKHFLSFVTLSNFHAEIAIHFVSIAVTTCTFGITAWRAWSCYHLTFYTRQYTQQYLFRTLITLSFIFRNLSNTNNLQRHRLMNARKTQQHRFSTRKSQFWELNLFSTTCVVCRQPEISRAAASVYSR